MAQQIQEVMTKDIQSVAKDANLRTVACLMHDKNIGDVLVTNPDGSLFGIVTDRDLVVRGMASQRDAETTKVADVCSGDIVEVSPTTTVDEAAKLMRKHAIRRIPVVSNGKPVGIVTIGDLAQAKDPNSALGKISAARPNA
jgi:CBS domain-containing protein